MFSWLGLAAMLVLSGFKLPSLLPCPDEHELEIDDGPGVESCSPAASTPARRLPPPPPASIPCPYPSHWLVGVFSGSQGDVAARKQLLRLSESAWADALMELALCERDLDDPFAAGPGSSVATGGGGGGGVEDTAGGKVRQLLFTLERLDAS